MKYKFRTVASIILKTNKSRINYGNIPLITPDDGYAAYRRGLQGISGEYALEWKADLSTLRLYLRTSLQTHPKRRVQGAVQV